MALWSQMDIENRKWSFPAMQREGRGIVTLDLTPSMMDLLDRARNFAHGEMEGFVFPSRQGIAKPFRDQSLSMSLKRAGMTWYRWTSEGLTTRGLQMRGAEAWRTGSAC